MSTTFVSINNQIYAENDAKINISDLAIQRGFGIFDFLKTVNGKAIFVEDHLDRFFNSSKEMNLEIGYTRAELLSTVANLMEANNLPNSGIKIILTGGYSPDGYAVVKSNLIITQVPFEIKNYNDNEGLRLVTYNHQRQLPTVKTIDYLQAIRLHGFVKENNADDLLYHNNGQLCECPRANFFIVTDNEIITPKSNILRGITRSKILKLNIEGYTVVERDFTLEDLKNAKEAFVSSSTKNAHPVLAIDGVTIGNGTAGKVTKEINNCLLELIKQA